MSDPIRVGIAGAGSIAFATAALLHDNGHAPMLWSPSGAGTAPLKDAPLTAGGAVETRFAPGIADTARQLADENDLLLIALPAYGHKAAMDALAPHIRDGQHVIISSHASLGAVYLMQMLAARGVQAPITAWGTTVVTGRRQEGPTVNVNTVRSRVDLCTVPDTRSDCALAICRRLFGDRFQPRDGLLAISLSNLNPQNHMGIALGNITRMERGETWSQGQNVTPKVGRLLEQLDLERLAIAEALGLEVKTIFEHFHLSFHVPVASISEMNQQMHALGNGGTGPATADSRYVTEDVPYGLQLTAVLGRLAGRPAVLHQAGIDIFSAMYGRDFAAENTLLNALELDRFGLDDLRQAARTGMLRTTPPVAS
ncbi:NAD/NADP-dependent octopine/nopaline dehydrogenase family protein [Frigidibacter sp. ROC022]|uniref:NAD/NADP-dependent octopine/nopaline dehydrogenase family protein n=1 Tax=Frigidibacter sp. ROC022 TaxID=2971796 RepID=UPI00215A1731|nr:NAD/NADP-dependent octopine/nopaline dehydrogenase family protein [Frigidibacter sp. ROC022]MCR8725803.1 NAD/NADP octopine/nopaline dehydrogenase family protein [Frigidibacter sp. ROC022]